MRHKIETTQFSQGWLEGQLETLVNKTTEKSNEDPTAHLIATAVWEQWTVVSESLDDLIKENAELKRKLGNAQVALS